MHSMAREMGTKTAYPGIWSLGGKRFRVRLYVKCPKTGRHVERERVIEAANASAANERRAVLTKSEADAGTRRARMRFDAFVASWIEATKPKLSRSTLARYVRTAEVLTDALGAIYIDALSASDVTTWRDATSKVAAASTVNGYMRVLRTILSSATRQRVVTHNVATEVAMLPDEREQGARVLTADELARLIDALRAKAPTWYAFFMVQAQIGGRFSEVSALRWSEIDLESGVITVRRSQWSGHERERTKTGAIRRVPILPEVVAMLGEIRREQIRTQSKGLASGLVFPSRYTGGFRSRHSASKPLKAAATAAGLNRRPTSHWLRHTLSDLLRQVATGQVQRAITGHATEAMAEHYSHVTLDERRAALTLVSSRGLFRDQRAGKSEAR